MMAERERALTLAHEAEAKDGLTTATAVVERARIYFNFLIGASDAKTDNAGAAAEGGASGF
jgi:hypothetical protein